MMRVLMTSVPGFGHVGPILRVGRAMHDAGHEVRVATHPELHALVAQAGVAPVAAGMTQQEMVSERRRRWPETDERPTAEWAIRMFTQIMAPAMRRDLLAVAADWRPDLIVHEEGEYAGAVVATELDIPWVTHGWGSPLRSQDDLLRLEADADPLWRDAGLDVPPAGGLYAYGLIDPCPPSLQGTRPGVTFVWTVCPETPRMSTDRPENEPTIGGPLAYVGFGTVPVFADAPAELAAAVDACLVNGMRAVVTTSNEVLGEQLVSAHGDRVAVRSFVSLPDLLPRCRVVVCHGGVGTVLAALSAGVPLVLVPRGAPSQLRMAQACVAAGVAVSVPATELSAMSAAVSIALDKAHAERLLLAAGEIRAMPSADELVPSLEAVANA